MNKPWVRVLRGAERLASLQPQERREAAHALVAVALIEFGLRTASIRMVAKVAGVKIGVSRGVSTGASEVPGGDASYIRSSERHIARALRLFRLPNTCLRRSLALGALHRNKRPVLRFGAFENAGTLHNHAWLELGGPPSVAEPGGPTWQSLGSARP